MTQFHFTSKEQQLYAEACLSFAQKIGLIDDNSFERVALRCEKENEKRRVALENGEIVYGLKQFTLPIYLDYELTRIKLDFASEKQVIKNNYNYKEITKDDLLNFYNNNKDLFTRYHGEEISFCDAEEVIYKKIREEQFCDEINKILRQHN